MARGVPFKKGNPGKPKGAKHEKTLAWEGIGEYLINEGADRAREIMMKSADKDFMNHFNTLLEYFKPKLARTELTGKNGGAIAVKDEPDYSKLSNDEKLQLAKLHRKIKE